MGSPVSPVVADIFMEGFEEKALSVQEIGSRTWKRSVDDVIAVIKEEKSKLFLSISINSMSRWSSLWRKKEMVLSHR